jgi:hypothetical protein
MLEGNAGDHGAVARGSIRVRLGTVVREEDFGDRTISELRDGGRVAQPGTLES